jgi:pimeloyl-ACP methyl ester carboxylesterase
MSSRQKLLNQRLPPEPPIPPAALLNYEAVSSLMTERGHVRLPEGELIAMWNFDRPFLAGTPGIDARIQQAIIAAIEAPDYAAIKVPALAIYAIPEPGKALPPWYDTNDAELMATLTELGRINANAQRKSIELFRRGVSQGEALEMPNATHWLIQSNQQQVLEAIETFSLQLKDR